ncbi:MAG: ferritin-like domain-containing protein [Deltaproteobacteria bacterium]|nr:ferritin-like domain-containing protein [Deltaproteobacteria bacterium]
MSAPEFLASLAQVGPIMRDAVVSGNWKVLAGMLGPGYRGFVQHIGKRASSTKMPSSHAVHFDWEYRRDNAEMSRLYENAKKSQWNCSVDIDWNRDIDPFDPNVMLLPEEVFPVQDLPTYQKLNTKEKAIQRHALLAWLLSQFLHGEQGALYAAAQVTEAVPWLDAKLYGSTQVVDEGRHVETFYHYLENKLEKRYEINDNLYVVIDMLMTDSRWDMKFLGMQIMIEGLALGAFSTIRNLTQEPMLKDFLKYIITDEARHVHFGVLSLKDYIAELSDAERREREDWTFEVSLFLRNRFLAHEFYDEFYAHAISRATWDKLVLESQFMDIFRKTMFKRIIPNLKRIGLLSDRIRPYYNELGLLAYENHKNATQLSAKELLDEDEVLIGSEMGAHHH